MPSKKKSKKPAKKKTCCNQESCGTVTFEVTPPDPFAQRLSDLEAVVADLQSALHNNCCCEPDYMYEEDVKKENILKKLLGFFRRS